jgi:hypothetical protein
VATAVPLIGSVPQPLWDWMKVQEKAEVEAVLGGAMAIPSCSGNRVR